jgi:hypothetical protein
MNYVLDSNILLRMAQDTHPMHAIATHATTTLLYDKARLFTSFHKTSMSSGL